MLENMQARRVPSRFSLLIRLLVGAFFIQLLTLTVPSLVQQVEQVTTALQQEQMPVRIVANSNERVDQQRKQMIVNYYEQTAQLPNNARYKMAQGVHLMPARIVGARFYPQNYYDATVVTIGAGRGDNWFCAMFRQVCVPSQQMTKQKISFSIAQWWKRKK